MRRLIVLSLTFILLSIAVGACGDATPTPTAKGGGSGGPMPYCAPEDLQVPVLYSPTDGENIDIPGLTFHGVYNPTDCIPRRSSSKAFAPRRDSSQPRWQRQTTVCRA